MHVVVFSCAFSRANGAPQQRAVVFCSLLAGAITERLVLERTCLLPGHKMI